MTVLFCDVAGFITTSERMTPQGLVKILNQYFSTMSTPIRDNDGIIDKNIGDAIMAYWGPPFNNDSEQTHLASLAALDMIARLESLRNSFPELLGMRSARPYRSICASASPWARRLSAVSAPNR